MKIWTLLCLLSVLLTRPCFAELKMIGEGENTLVVQTDRIIAITAIEGSKTLRYFPFPTRWFPKGFHRVEDAADWTVNEHWKEAIAEDFADGKPGVRACVILLRLDSGPSIAAAGGSVIGDSKAVSSASATVERITLFCPLSLVAEQIGLRAPAAPSERLAAEDARNKAVKRTP